MFRAALLVACIASASAFAPSSILPRAGARAPVARGPRMQNSESVPFLQAPPKLSSSMPGYAGFDPLRFSDLVDPKWLQEGEIKNGRVAMLAVLGLIVPEVFTLPMFKAGATPLDNLYTVPAFGLFQIFFALGALDVWSHNFKITTSDMFDGHTPGNFGFDPLGFGKDANSFKRNQVAEIKNGRLAMLAVGGIVHQQLLTKSGSLYFLTHFKAIQ